jgi:hypothetical protein
LGFCRALARRYSIERFDDGKQSAERQQQRFSRVEHEPNIEPQPAARAKARSLEDSKAALNKVSHFAPQHAKTQGVRLGDPVHVPNSNELIRFAYAAKRD